MAPTLKGETLLHSPEIGDNVLAVLARLGNRKVAVAQIVRRIAGLDAAYRFAGWKRR